VRHHKNHKSGQIDSISVLQFRAQIPINEMMNPGFLNRIGKACALAAATLILPVLAHAQTAQLHPVPEPPIHPAPEANPGWVLIPFVGAVLLFSMRRLLGAKAQADSN